MNYRQQGPKITTARLIVKRWCESKGTKFHNAPATTLLIKTFKMHGGVASGKHKNERIFSAAMSIAPDFKRPPKIKTIASNPDYGSYQKKAHIFYKSSEWRRLRYDVLLANDGRCELCGSGKVDGIVLNVDHIKSLRDYWHRRLDIQNLQVLCNICNHGKGNRDDTDWREPSLRVLMGEEMA